jgi:hypothetical protein
MGCSVKAMPSLLLGLPRRLGDPAWVRKSASVPPRSGYLYMYRKLASRNSAVRPTTSPCSQDTIYLTK